VKVHVLLNPAGAGGATLRRWRRIEALGRSLFPELVVHQSTAPGDLREAARSLAGAEVLVLAAGGDGTSHEVINGLVDGRSGLAPAAAMGWLPLGSGNDLARSNGVPLDGQLALRHYRAVVTELADVGILRYRDVAGVPLQRAFGNSVTFGLSAAVLELVAAGGKPLGGRLSYFLATLRALVTAPPAVLSLDGVEGRFRLVSITNGTRFGAGMRITPAARLDDGELDLVTVAALSRLETALVFPRIYWGGHLRHPAVHHRRIRGLTVTAAGSVPFEADGELFLGNPPFEVSVAPRALRVAHSAVGASTH